MFCPCKCRCCPCSTFLFTDIKFSKAEGRTVSMNIDSNCAATPTMIRTLQRRFRGCPCFVSVLSVFPTPTKSARGAIYTELLAYCIYNVKTPSPVAILSPQIQYTDLGYSSSLLRYFGLSEENIAVVVCPCLSVFVHVCQCWIENARKLNKNTNNIRYKI